MGEYRFGSIAASQISSEVTISIPLVHFTEVNIS